MLATFDSSRDLLAWAREDISDLAALEAEFIADPENYQQITTTDVAAREEALAIRIAKVPAPLRKKATYALWGIKHALDHAMRASVSEITCSDPGDVPFLVSSHPNDLRARLRHPKSRYPGVLHELIESFEIYPTGSGYVGGNDEFCALNQMANNAKHGVALSAKARAKITGMRGEGMVGGARLFVPAPVNVEGDLAIGVFPMNSLATLQLELNGIVAFEGIPQFLNVSAADVLGAFANSAESAMTQLEVEAGRISGQMG